LFLYKPLKPVNDIFAVNSKEKITLPYAIVKEGSNVSRFAARLLRFAPDGHSYSDFIMTLPMGDMPRRALDLSTS
jgi:hypothetical protein